MLASNGVIHMPFPCHNLFCTELMLAEIYLNFLLSYNITCLYLTLRYSIFLIFDVNLLNKIVELHPLYNKIRRFYTSIHPYMYSYIHVRKGNVDNYSFTGLEVFNISCSKLHSSIKLISLSCILFQ